MDLRPTLREIELASCCFAELSPFSCALKWYNTFLVYMDISHLAQQHPHASSKSASEERDQWSGER